MRRYGLEPARTTVFGRIQSHTHRAGGKQHLVWPRYAPRQRGCIRFVMFRLDPTRRGATNASPTCQAAVEAQYSAGDIDAAQRDVLLQAETLRVEPDFDSDRYGRPAYCRLAPTCAPEIATGADDESEMGVFHDLYAPQRAANLRQRLDEYTPAGTDAGIIYAIKEQCREGRPNAQKFRPDQAFQPGADAAGSRAARRRLERAGRDPRCIWCGGLPRTCSPPAVEAGLASPRWGRTSSTISSSVPATIGSTGFCANSSRRPSACSASTFPTSASSSPPGRWTRCRLPSDST